MSEKAREPTTDVIGQALTVASGAQAVASLTPLSPAERLLVALSEAVRAAEEAREAARACLAGEIAQRAAVEQLDAVQRERDELRESAERAGARVIELERERDDLRAALGGAAPSDDDELIAEAVSLARRPVSDTALRGALADVLAELGADLGADPLSDEELGALAVQRAGEAGEAIRAAEKLADEQRAALVAAVEGAILELTGERAVPSKPLAEQLLTAARDYGPRAGSFSTELETEVFASIHRLTGEAGPIGEGRAALARALRDAVTAELAKRSPPATAPTPIRRPAWATATKENS